MHSQQKYRIREKLYIRIRTITIHQKNPLSVNIY